MSSPAVATENRDNMLAPSDHFSSGQAATSNSREQSSMQWPLSSTGSQIYPAAHTANGHPYHHTVDETTQSSQSVPDGLAFFPGACVGEDSPPHQYASSVTTSYSLPGACHEHRSSTGPRCYSDNGQYGPSADRPPQFFSRMARSESPTTAVHLWQVQQDDWKTHGPARSVTQAKRRRKHRVRQSLDRIDAALLGKGEDIDEKGVQEE